MSTSDKAVKFSFVVDQRSLQQTQNAIRQLTRDIKQLVEQMDRAGSSLGGLGGRGGSLFGGMSGRAGGINPAQQSTIKGGSVITQGITADAKALSQVARAGTDAMKQMTSGVRDGIFGQVREIERLKNVLKDLNSEYEKLRKAGAIGGIAGTSVSAQIQQTKNLLAANEIANARSMGGGGFLSPGQRIVNRGGIDYVEEGGGGPGMFARAKNYLMNSKKGLLGGTVQQSFGERMDEAGGGVVGFARAAGPAIAAGVAAAYTAARGTELAVNYGKDIRSQGADFNTYQMMLGQRQAAGTNQVYGGLAQQYRNDIVTRIAVSNMLKRGAVGDTVNKTRENLKTQVDSVKLGVVGGVADETYRGLGGIGSSVRGKLRSWGMNLAPEEEYRFKKISQNEAAANEIGQQQARMRGDIPQKLADITTERVQNAISEMTVRERELLTNWANSNGARLAASRMARTTHAQTTGVNTVFDEGEMNAMRAQLANTAGGKFMGLAGRALSLQSGGLTAAPQVIAAAGAFGDPKTMLNVLAGGSSMFGKAGLMDSAGANQLAQLVASQMMAGNLGPMNHAMGGLLRGGMEMGGGVQAANLMGMGLGQAGAINAGATSPMQMALNTIASQRIAGSLYGGRALAGLSPLEEMEAMRGGAVPKHLLGMRGMGTPEEIRSKIAQYVEARNSTSFFGFRSGKGLEQEDALVAAVRGQGYSNAVKSQLSGGQSLNELSFHLGRAQAFSRGGAGAADIGKFQAEQMIRIMNSPAFEDLKGGSVGAVTDKKDRELKKLFDQNKIDNERDLAKYVAAHPEVRRQLSDEMQGYLKTLDNSLAGGVDGAADKAAKALNDLAASIRKKEGGSPTKANAPAAPAATKTKPR